MGELDMAAKVLIAAVPEPFVRLFLGDVAIRDVRAEDSEVQALARRMDELLRVELEGEEQPLWVHVEVQAAWKADMPRRVFDYWTLARRGRPNLLAVVLCLAKGNKQGAPVERFEVVVRGRRRLLFEFDVLRAWVDLQASKLVAEGPVGLLPLVPFAGGTSRVHVHEALTRLGEIEDPDQRRELRVTLATFAEQAFQEEGWLARIPLEELMESTTWKQIGAEFEARGQRSVLEFQLDKRLHARAEPLVARLRTAPTPVLKKVAELLAEQCSEDDLANRLDALLPQQDEAE